MALEEAVTSEEDENGAYAPFRGRASLQFLSIIHMFNNAVK